MKVGFNMLLWTTHVTEEDLPHLETLKKVGYDGVGIPVFEGDTAHFEKIGRVIKDTGLTCTSVTVIPDEEHNPASADAGHREGAVEYFKWSIDCSAALGSEVLCGPFYQPLGFFTGKVLTEEEKRRVAEGVIKAAKAAKRIGVKVVNGFSNWSIWRTLYRFPFDVEQVIEDEFACFAKISTLIVDELYKCDLQFALQPAPPHGLHQKISKPQEILKSQLIPKPQMASKPRNKLFEFKVHKKVERYVDKEVTYSLKLPPFLANWLRKLGDCFNLLFAKLLHKPSVR